MFAGGGGVYKFRKNSQYFGEFDVPFVGVQRKMVETEENDVEKF